MAGCLGPTQPGSFVHGTVRYTDGRPVERALVLIEGGDRTFTNAAGIAQLPASGMVNRSPRATAHAGTGYAETHSGSVVPRQPGIVADVVLDTKNRLT
jgi:hypothetical protein